MTLVERLNERLVTMQNPEHPASVDGLVDAVAASFDLVELTEEQRAELCIETQAFCAPDGTIILAWYSQDRPGDMPEFAMRGA